MKTLTRDETEHGVEYVTKADALDAIADARHMTQPQFPHPIPDGGGAVVVRAEMLPLLLKLVQDAFSEGFYSVATYNDKLENTPEEAWPTSSAKSDAEAFAIEHSRTQVQVSNNPDAFEVWYRDHHGSRANFSRYDTGVFKGDYRDALVQGAYNTWQAAILALRQAPAAPASERIGRDDLMVLMSKAGYVNVPAQEKADFINGFRHAEVHHSIGQQPATANAPESTFGNTAQATAAQGEPVASPLEKRCYTMSESHLSGYRLIIGFETLDDLQAAHTFVATPQPAPAVADAAAVPLQVLKDASEALGHFVSDHGWGDADMQAMDNLDAYIARAAAQRGGE